MNKIDAIKILESYGDTIDIAIFERIIYKDENIISISVETDDSFEKNKSTSFSQPDVFNLENEINIIIIK